MTAENGIAPPAESVKEPLSAEPAPDLPSPQSMSPLHWLFVWMIALALCIGLESLREPTDFFFGDESRHAMNGVLIHDYVRDLLTNPDAPRHPKTYALQFYARYPAVSLGYHPPLVPLVEAGMYALFGVSKFSAHLAIALFFAFGLVMYYGWLYEGFGPVEAAIAVGLLILPLMAYWGSAVMLEIPAISLLIGASFYLWRYSEHERTHELYLAWILAALAVNAKQTAGMFLVYGLAFLFLQFHAQLFRKIHVYGALVVYGLLLLPLAYLTLKFGGANLSENVGGGGVLERWSVAAWTYYLWRLPEYVGWFFAPMLLGGLVLAVVQPRRSAVTLALCWIVTNYLTMTLVSYKSVRLGMLWIPPLWLLCILFFTWVSARFGKYHFGEGQKVAFFVLLLILPNHLNTAANGIVREDTRSLGIEQVAVAVQEEWAGETVLYDGWHNGSFIFYMRMLDPHHERIILRGSKSLSATRVMTEFGSKQFVKTEAELLDFLRRHRTGLVVLEKTNLLELAHAHLLRKTVKNHPELFTRVAEIPLEAKSARLQQASPVTIYRFAGPFPESNGMTITLEFLTTGDTIEVPLRARKGIR